ncbi:glycogen synthase GlgA [Mesobacillus zeae]|uniref:Glycogen synthase n=1 Tax=Mesobacillus zeae TaxID=1917180 RepID=A0A398B6B1_9BACI|nr:glycogen synthase GlgA [Mesobacillus zeae]RID83296.1 glycogen synthase GlgA [Mesobacillus zeae]
MKVLFAVSECVPFIKSGGLADVAGTLPSELKKAGADIRVILPKYALIPEKFKKAMKKRAEFIVQVGWRRQYCGIEELKHEGITYYFIDNEYYFKRNQMYGDYDDGEKFAYFNRAVLEAMFQIEFFPDILHCHDWHAGMIPFLLRTEYNSDARCNHIKTVFTIHNLQFQGIFPPETLGDLLGLSYRYFNPEQLEFYGNINFMKAALVSSDKITTVSPTYMEEIQTPYFGEKLDGILRMRKADLKGVLNGIDNSLYDPSNDSSLEAAFTSRDLAGKQLNKMSLQCQYGLPENEQPLMAMVTRLTKQKGLDLVRGIFHEIMKTGVQMIVLGTGDIEFEQFLTQMASQYPQQCRVLIGFDESLAHRIYAGADMFLMPSKFEPCGLSQLIAMRYGTVPIVRETGGLNDTVQSYNPEDKSGSGFTFTNFNAHDMLFTIERALAIYRNNQEWNNLVQTVMELDFSWSTSAKVYQELYKDLITGSETHVC